MKTVDPSVRAQLWESVKGQVEQPLALFLYNGIKPKAGQDKNEALFEAMMEVCRNLYEAGLDRGYDMGYEIAKMGV